MNELDVYYRALLDFCRATSAVRECNTLTSAIASADMETDKIVVTRARCTVEEDWVLAIEEGLVHIEKAIKEERQFIQSNGETVPIEKVKNVSKESVQHLAKHGNLITRVPEEGEDIVPDKLYTVERLNEYAVYENRFLYMLLCYIRDFVTIRYNDILSLTNKYEGTLDISKKISVSKRTMDYTVSLKEERRDDRYLRENNSAKDIIDRIDLILKTILAFLATPLMECTAKVAMIKPPITKTNVLKMDNNFKGAVKLYDFIIAYDKPGYLVEKDETKLSPFREDLAEELAQAGAIISFLTYEYGLGIKNHLKERYNEEERRRKAEELKKKTEQLEALGRKIKSSGMTLEEYVLEVEKHLRALAADNNKIEPLRKEVETLKNIEREQSEKIKELLSDLEHLKEEMEEERIRHQNEIFELKDAHEKEIADLKDAHEQELVERHLKYQNEIETHKQFHQRAMAEVRETHQAEMQQLRDRYNGDMDKMKATQEAEKLSMQARLNQAEESTRFATNALKEKMDECDKVLERCLIAEALVKALRAEKGAVEGDFTDKANFDQLEREYQAFTRFYNAAWVKAKKRIRKDILNMNNLRRKGDGK